MITPNRGIVAGLLAVAASITFAAFQIPKPPRFQLANFDNALVARVNTQSGAIELCGRVSNAIDILKNQTSLNDWAKPGTALADIQKAQDLQVKSALDSNCFELLPEDPQNGPDN